jgi:hypothetical protein
MIAVGSNIQDSGFSLVVVVGGVTIANQSGGAGGDSRRTGFVSCIVPNSTTYVVTYSGGATGSTLLWAELR